MLKPFFIKNLSLQVRIFLAMILLTVISSILIAIVSIYQFKKEAKDYHQDRLERKETAIVEHINYVLQTTTYPLSTENIPLIFREKIFELADIHSMEINFYDLKGNLLISSKKGFKSKIIIPKISSFVLQKIETALDKRYLEVSKKEDKTFRTTYSYLKDTQFKPLGILNLPYEENTEFYDNEVQNFLIRFGQVYFVMFLISILLSYFISSYITKTLKFISDKMEETQLNQRNEKITIEDASKEINLLVKSYNNMVEKLEESAVVLAQSEREQAWREMAKQVAHEIKNPLTPMRLTVQSFQRKFDKDDPNITKKLADYTQSILQQIDTMSAVASAFSNFASMPAQQNETLNVVQIVQMALEIFNEDYIEFEAAENEIITIFDRTQLIRLITNLVKNAIQAIPEEQIDKKIKITVFQEQNQVKISVKDNGIGISEENAQRIFEPKFTTKSSGMGLGLAIIKNSIENYNGTIIFVSKINEGTEFIVSFPITNHN